MFCWIICYWHQFNTFVADTAVKIGFKWEKCVFLSSYIIKISLIYLTENSIVWCSRDASLRFERDFFSLWIWNSNFTFAEIGHHPSLNIKIKDDYQMSTFMDEHPMLSVMDEHPSTKQKSVWTKNQSFLRIYNYFQCINHFTEIFQGLKKSICWFQTRFHPKIGSKQILLLNVWCDWFEQPIQYFFHFSSCDLAHFDQYSQILRLVDNFLYITQLPTNLKESANNFHLCRIWNKNYTNYTTSKWLVLQNSGKWIEIMTTAHVLDLQTGTFELISI